MCVVDFKVPTVLLLPHLVTRCLRGTVGGSNAPKDNLSNNVCSFKKNPHFLILWGKAGNETLPRQLLSLVSQRYCPPPNFPSLSFYPPFPPHCSLGSSSQGSGWEEDNGTPCLRVGSMSPSPLTQTLNKSPLLLAWSPVSLRLHVQTKRPPPLLPDPAHHRKI